MAITDGDILSALSDIRIDTSKISKTISDMSEKDIHQIQQDLSTLVRLSQGTRRAAENDRFQRERDERARDRQFRAQGSFKSSFSSFKGSRGRSSSYDGVIDEFLGSVGKGLEDELKKSLADSPVSRELKGYLKKFADDLGIEVSQIPSALGQEIGKQLLKNTQLGQSLTSTIQNIQDSIFNSVKNAAKQGASRYARSTGRNSYQDIYNDFVENFRTSQGGTSRSTSRAASESVNAATSARSRAVGNAVSSAVGSAAGSVVGRAASAEMMSAGVPMLTAGSSTALASTSGGSLMAAGAAGGAAPLMMALPHLAVAALAAAVVIDKFSEAIGPATEGVKKFNESAKKASNRYWESRKQMIKEEQNRIEADIKTMAETPFKILEDAAQKWYDAWDNNLKKIGQTQGYTKADVQTLFGSYASRLRAEGLERVISAADISSSLGQVLEAGLSGKVAEEFAYQATLLGSAIPNQDFFSYADTYGQIVGNALARGLSKDAAIQEATKQMQQHASNLLYAGRNISDGIASALKDGSSLFADAVKIANTARTGESSQISAVLTAAAAEVSAIAPDLASDLISNIVQAAVGGNNSDLVALRSMAGIGASNTAFIQALATNPQQVFAALFSNLATMQNLDKNNYMEVAESLSQTFGISASAFERINFTALAEAISSMKVNQSALNENLKLLKSGETTSSLEATRYQQINQVILDEGLSYVLDSEAGRAIQQHMWDQELANEIMEREYSVDLAGSAKEMLEGILETVHNILDFLNPFSWIGKLFNITATGAEYNAQKADLSAILEATKVGSGNINAFRSLTNYNGAGMNNVPSLADLLGFNSQYAGIHGGLEAFNRLGQGALYEFTQTMMRNNALPGLETKSPQSVTSTYRWGFVGKSLANAISSSPLARDLKIANMAVSSGDAIRKKEAAKMNELLDSMQDAVKANQSYDEWKNAAMRKYNITDFSAALTRVGLTEAQAQGQFQAQTAAAASERSWKRDETEDKFWEQSETYYLTTFPNTMQTIIELLSKFYDSWENEWLAKSWKQDWLQGHWESEWIDAYWSQQWLNDNWKTFREDWAGQWLSSRWDKWQASWNAWFPVDLNKDLKNFYSIADLLKDWVNRYVTYKVYTDETRSAYKAIKSITKNEKKRESGDAVLALAKALTASSKEMVSGLQDPQVQTNALLSQILIVIEAILQAENTSGGASLATSLSALGLGLTT